MIIKDILKGAVSAFKSVAVMLLDFNEYLFHAVCSIFSIIRTVTGAFRPIWIHFPHGAVGILISVSSGLLCRILGCSISLSFAIWLVLFCCVGITGFANDFLQRRYLGKVKD